MYLLLFCLLCAFACVLSGTDLKSTSAGAASDETSPPPRILHGSDTAFEGDSGRHRFRRAAPTKEKVPRHGHQGTTLSYVSDQEAVDDPECPPLDTLDFLHYNKSNPQEVEKLEKEYPCDLRIYWKSANIQNLVSVVRFLFNYITIVLIIIGILVNVYSLFVLNSPPINKCNMSVYLKALALSDIGALIFNVSVGVLRARCAWISNFYLNNGWMCTLHKILLSVFFYYSTWLVVTFTIERLLMIRNPFKIHTWQNEKPAKLTVVILAIVTLGLALIRSLTTPGFENDNMYGYEPCGTNSHKISVNMVPFMLINNIVPSILITTTNICLLIHVRRSAQDHNNLMATDDQTTTCKITRMLIIISVVYVILYLPVGISSCTELYYRKHEPPKDDHFLHVEWAKKMMLVRWIRGLCFFLYLLNYVNNFFLYCLSGDIFRQAVKVCLPNYLKKICPCISTKATTSRNTRQRFISHSQSTSHRTMGASSRKPSLPTCMVSENSYQNSGFINEEANTTHL